MVKNTKEESKENEEIETSLNSDLIFGFAGTLLSQRFDNPKPSPPFHKELWDFCCSEEPWIAIGAPRGHAKSTAITHTYTLAAILFRVHQYVIIVSDTEGQSKEFLNNIKVELRENTDLQNLFNLNPKLHKDTETDIIGSFGDGQQFRITAKGSEQKLRGMNWRGRRPDLIIGDDLENDELVGNEQRREKFRNWFFGALMPVLSDRGRIIVVGTVLHLDSLLERLLNDPQWAGKRYEAHDDNFENILWPEKFPLERLKKIRQSYITQGFPEGYSQEYRNNPIDIQHAFFRSEDLLEATETDQEESTENYLAMDLAISEKKKAAYTVIAAGGRTSSGYLIIKDIRRGRWDSKRIIDELFSSVLRYKPEEVLMESDKVAKALGPIIYDEMHRRGIYFKITSITPSGDKTQRARPLQYMMKAGGVKFNKRTDWYNDLESEMLTFPKGAYKDQVDALAYFGLHLNKLQEGLSKEEIEEEEYNEELEESGLFFSINPYTGY